MFDVVRRALHPLFRRVPRLRSILLSGIEAAVRPALLPFRLSRPPSSGHRLAPLAARTEELNRAAERYFAEYPAPEHVLDKPFSEAGSCSRRLIDAGVLIDGLRLRPGDVVLELGAGTCWLSHFLNRFGCRTIAVDVSPTALALGRKLFEQDPRTNWGLAPEFAVYDGHILPAADASVDHVVLYDAYHHLPNPGELMREMRRVLRRGGIVAMSEPGRGHAASASSLTEEAATGVLENELALEDVAELALASGFTAARVVVAPNEPLLEIDALDLRSFMAGRGFARYWKGLCAALDGHHYILLFADDPRPTTARPKRLKAVITRLGERRAIRRRTGESTRVVVDLYNAGDTRWLAGEGTTGWTRLGAHLHRADEARTLVDYDWVRAPLPADVESDQRVRIPITLPSIEEPGSYIAVVDLVIEGVAWFAERGSVPLDVHCDVE